MVDLFRPMPGFVHLLRCVGRAVVKHAGKALCSLVPFGEFVSEVAIDTFQEYRATCGEAAFRSDLKQLALAPQEAVRQVAEQVAVQEAASHPEQVRLALASYLSHMPATIRRTLRRRRCRARSPAGIVRMFPRRSAPDR